MKQLPVKDIHADDDVEAITKAVSIANRILAEEAAKLRGAPAYNWEISFEYGHYRSGSGSWLQCVADIGKALHEMEHHNGDAFSDHPAEFRAKITPQ